MFSCVTGSGTYDERLSNGGGVRPPRVTEDRKPDVCKERDRRKCKAVEGMDVRPRRALEAFWRCEHTCERLTRDMLCCD